MKLIVTIFLLGVCWSVATAQNRLYVYVDYDPSMQLLGFGGSGFYYDHILLLPDGTAFRFDDVSENFDQVLPSGINLATATTNDLANAGGTQGTYQHDGTTVQTSFGVSFASAGETFAYEDEVNGYMLIPPLQPSFITGEYRNFSATVIGAGTGSFTGGPQVSAGESNNYYFYGDGKFGFEESKGVASNAGNVATVFSEEGSAAGDFLFEGYNLYLTYNDGTQAILPAYLWPSASSFEDQILMVANDEFLNEEESIIPIQILPAGGAGAPQNAQNPLSGTQQEATQNPLTQPAQGEGANPLSQPGEQPQATENPLATPSTETPATPSGNTLSGTVNAPDGVVLSSAYVALCPADLANADECAYTFVDEAGTYSLEIPGAGDYLVLAGVDVDGNETLNTGDYVSYQRLSGDGGAQTLDLVLEPYSE